MRRAMHLNRMAYRVTTLLYPSDFRRRFGEEMLETFTEDLVAQRTRRGIRGVFAVWRIALSELLRMAPRLWLRSSSIAAPALTALAMMATASPTLVLAIERQVQPRLRPGETPLLDAVMAMAVDGMVAALTAFIAVQRTNCQPFTGLGILRSGE